MECIDSDCLLTVPESRIRNYVIYYCANHYYDVWFDTSGKLYLIFLFGQYIYKIFNFLGRYIKSNVHEFINVIAINATIYHTFFYV